jgi:predicted Zn finger-like uncharacterized protein
MIVKCEQCQTRFKIPDEKVTEKGVKVRCTKCQHTFRVKRDGTSAATGQFPAAAPTQQVPAMARPPDDPFAKFGAATDDGMGEATRPGMYALGVEASRHSGPLQPSFAAQMDLPPQVFEQPTRVGTLPTAPPGRKPLRDEVTQQSSPFDFAAALGGAEPPAPPPFDFDGPPGLRAPEEYDAPPAPAYNQPSDTSGHDPFANMELGEQTNPVAPITTQPEVPSVFGSGSGDFFASTEPPPPPQSMRPDALGLSEGGEVEADTSQRAALFDMPPPEPNRIPEGFNNPSADVEAVPIARLKLVSMPAGGAVAPSEPREATRPRRRIGGLIFNVAIASVLVALLTVIVTVYLSEGKVELASFNPERLKATFSSPTEWATLDISNGLYDTRSGRAVFFVRGDVKNRSAKATRAKVRAEILDGNTAIRHVDVWIGVAPTPEDLYAIAVADDVDLLVAKLEKSAAEVMPGEKRGFLVPFYEYPPDLKGFRVKVTVIEAGQGETAAR